MLCLPSKSYQILGYTSLTVVEINKRSRALGKRLRVPGSMGQTSQKERVRGKWHVLDSNWLFDIRGKEEIIQNKYKYVKVLKSHQSRLWNLRRANL